MRFEAMHLLTCLPNRAGRFECPLGGPSDSGATSALFFAAVNTQAVRQSTRVSSCCQADSCGPKEVQAPPKQPGTGAIFLGEGRVELVPQREGAQNGNASVVKCDNRG